MYVLTTLSKKQVQLLLTSLLNRDTPQKLMEPLNAYAQLTLYLYEWLNHWGCFTDMQMQKLLINMDDDIVILSDVLENDIKELQDFCVTIAEKNFAVWPGRITWYDMTTAKAAPDQSLQAVTFLVCHLHRLFTQKQQWLQKIQGGTNAGNPYSAVH